MNWNHCVLAASIIILSITGMMHNSRVKALEARVDFLETMQ